MQEIPGDLKFLKSHEWARVEDKGTVTVGISDHAQGLLGDLVYVELPSIGDTVKAGNAVAVVESVKAASDVYAPVSGEIVAVNEALPDKPETINEDAYGDGWLVEEHLFIDAPDEVAPPRWVAGTALDTRADSTVLSIFDAAHIGDGPIAQARLPYSLPLGLHGTFRSELARG